ncbi:22447_t:CDS:2, partial [Rhizophagus irregularis]
FIRILLTDNKGYVEAATKTVSTGASESFIAYSINDSTCKGTLIFIFLNPGITIGLAVSVNKRSSGGKPY